MQTIKRTSLLLAGMLASASGWAATSVGTQIENTATATYYAPSDATSPLTVSSSTAFVVQEKIDVAVTSSTTSALEVQAGSTAQVIEYTIKNTGNGDETFDLTVSNGTGDAFDVTNVKIYLDDGVPGFQGTETEVTQINLTPEQATKIFVVVDIPVAQSIDDIANIEFNVTSATPGAAAGNQGDILAGQGDGGTDAVLANNAGGAIKASSYKVTATAGLVVITKSILSTEHPTLGSVKVPGSVVTYQILVQVTAAVNNLRIVDDLPLNLTYDAGSLLLANSNLAGTPLTTTNASGNTDSAADADAGRYDANAGSNGRVTFVLGNQAAAGDYTIQFTATID